MSRLGAASSALAVLASVTIPAILAALVVGCPGEAEDPTSVPSCPAGMRWDGIQCSKLAGANKKSAAVPHLLEGADVSGTFAMAGVRADGTQYAGAASITTISATSAMAGPMYRVVASVGKNSFEGLALRDGDVLSVGWSDGGADFGVVSYLRQPDQSLDGVWFGAGAKTLGKELLVGGTPNMTGMWKITEGQDPSGAAYGGSVDVGLSEGVHRLRWHIGSQNLRGVGILGQSNGHPLLSVGFNQTGDFGVTQYRILSSGAKLEGKWAQFAEGTLEQGSETLTRQ